MIPKRLSVLLAVTSAVFVVAGCQKNSYESCIEFQTKETTRSVGTDNPQLLQKMIHANVSVYCNGVK